MNTQKKIFDNNFKEILFSEVVSIIGGIVGGTILAFYTNKILLIPGMLVLLPGFLEMRGNISGSFASRLSSGLFLGVVKPNKFHTKIIKGNIIASFFLATIISLFLGIISFLFSLLLFKVYIPKIIIIPLIAGVIANFIEIIATLYATFYIFRKGHDPNNIIGPFLTTTGDITSIVSLLIAVVII